MAKSAVLKPMPIASEATATSVNPGLFRSHRTAKPNVSEEGLEQGRDYSPLNLEPYEP